MFEKELYILEKKIQTSKYIAIFGHENIDGDSLGSGLGLGRVLEKLGKQVKYFTPKPVSKKLTFLPGAEKYNSEFDFDDYDLLIFVDTPSAEKQLSKFWSQNRFYWDSKFKVLIDHHLSSNYYANLNIVDPKRASTCDLVFEIIKKLWSNLIDQDIATCLLTGHLTDTNFCKWDSAGYKEIQLAGELVKHGGKKDLVLWNIYYNSSFDAIKFIGELINRIFFKQDIVYTYYTDDEIKKLGLDREDVDFIMDIMLKIADKKVYVLFRKEGENIKGSIRTKFPIANKIAEKIGGGGHAKAAGFKLSLEKDFNKQILDLSDKILNIYNNLGYESNN